MAFVGADRRRLLLLLVPIFVLVVASYVGTALAPTLAVEHPLLLLVLDARFRHLLLVSNSVDPFWFFVVGFIRLAISDPLFYLLGRWYGEAALRWFARTSGADRQVAWVQRWFPRVGPVLIFVAPNNPVCLLAGSTRMSPLKFVVLNAGGTAARLVLLLWLGNLLASPLEAVLDFIGRYQWWLTGATIALVLLTGVLRRGDGVLETPSEMEAELEAELGTTADGPGHDANGTEGPGPEA